MRLKSKITGVPDYFAVFKGHYAEYKKTGNTRNKELAFHYAKVAVEFGQAEIQVEGKRVPHGKT